MKDIKQKIKSVLVLSSIQSAGATVGIPLVAYFMVGGDNHTTMWYLIASLTLLHLGVFAHNDIADIWHDSNAGRTDKPLVSQDISRQFAMRYSASLIIIGIIIASQVVTQGSMALLIIGLFVGLLYNYLSSTTVLGPPLLGAWGVIIVLFGAEVGGGATIAAESFSMLTGISLGLVTFYADAADIDSDKKSLPMALGYSSISQGRMIASGDKSKPFLLIMIMFQSFFFIILVSGGVQYWWLSFCLFAMAVVTSFFMEFGIVNGEIFRRTLVVYTLLSVGFLVVAASPYAGALEVTTISAGIIGWAILSMKLLHGGGLEYA